uniref:RPA-interacting protein C-terminal domain-containing protein n=1 Tax=Arion vulgaris TaxID=1028688 RepID=A0A0B6ZB11_9EUPU
MSADKTRQEARHEMYKNFSRSPCWKEQFRKRCLERLKDRRSSHVLSRRSLDSFHENDLTTSNKRVKQRYNSDDKSGEEKAVQTGIQGITPDVDIIMKEEFDRLKREVSSEDIRSSTAEGGFQAIHNFCEVKNSQENHRLPTKNNSREEYNVDSSKNGSNYLFDVHDDNSFNVTDLVSWYEEIYATLRAELKQVEQEEKLHQQSLQNACDDHLQHVEEELCSAIQTLSTEDVICPLCEKFNLIESKNVIHCRCGLRIDVEQDSITLKYVRDSLIAGTEEHSRKCESKPSFSLNQKFGISNLIMSCQGCDFLFVIV